jgi:hypothetical protein
MAAQHPILSRIARVSAAMGIAAGLALTTGVGAAQAQFFGGWWGGWRHAEPMPEGVPIPPRRVERIVASEGFSLSGPPQRQGDVILADGVDGRGQRMRFVLDAYDGQILRTRLVGGPRPPGLIYGGPGVDVPSQAHAGLGRDEPGPTIVPGVGPRVGSAQPGFEAPRPLQKAKPPAKPKQSAARAPAKPAAAPIAPKVPSEAETVTPPASAKQEPVSAPPAAEAKAPAPAASTPATPLAPDATPVGTAPAPAPAPATTEAKAPAPKATQDIGPVVKKVEPAPAVAPAVPATTPDSK